MVSKAHYVRLSVCSYWLAFVVGQTLLWRVSFLHSKSKKNANKGEELYNTFIEFSFKIKVRYTVCQVSTNFLLVIVNYCQIWHMALQVQSALLVCGILAIPEALFSFQFLPFRQYTSLKFSAEQSLCIFCIVSICCHLFV